MPAGPSSPEISAAFTVAPAVVYSPIVSPPMLMTNRSEPDTATPNGLSSPEISAAFTVAPEVVYSPIVPFSSFATNRSEPDTTMPNGSINDPEISAGLTVAPEVVYAPIVPDPGKSPPFVTNRSEPDTAMPNGMFNPEISAAFTVIPEVGVFADRTIQHAVHDEQVGAPQRDPGRSAQPRDKRGVHRRSGGGVCADRAVVVVRFKDCASCARRAGREGCEQASKQARCNDFGLIKGLHRSRPDALRQSAQ